MPLPQMPLEFMQEAAEHLVALLEPDKTCKKIMIAGSIRRKKPFPGDVEIVLEPLLAGQPSMFAGELVHPFNQFDEHCQSLLHAGALEKRLDVKGRPRWGQRTKLALFFYQGKPVKADLFSVLEPAEWGTLLAIRTGSGAFNRRLVQHAHTVGRKVAGGQIWDLSGLDDGLRWRLSALPSDKFVKEATRLRLAVIPISTEEAYFEVLRVPCWPPEERTEQRLREFVRG